MKISNAIQSLTGHKRSTPTKAQTAKPAFAAMLQRPVLKTGDAVAARQAAATPIDPESATSTVAPHTVTTSGMSLMPQGDAANPLRGYVSAAGGRFGLGDTADRSQALRALESISGIDSGTTYVNGTYAGGDPTKFGLPANASAADVNELRTQWALVANGDAAGVQAGISSSNPILQQMARAEVARHPELLLPNAVGRRG